MSTLRTTQLKQLNALDKAITNLVKAIKLGEKEEKLGYNNGAMAVRAKELLEIYNTQFAITDDTDQEYSDDEKAQAWGHAVSRGVF